MMTKQLDLVNDPVKAVLVNENYVPSYNHASLLDIVPATRIATSGTLTARSVSYGVLDASALIVPAVSGDVIEAVVLIHDTGTAAPLIAYLDNSPDLPKNPNGGDITISWSTGVSKIFAL